MLVVDYKLQPKPKTVINSRDALQWIWTALPQKSKGVKDYHRQIEACVPADGGYL